MKWETLLERAYVPYSNKPMACIAKGESNRYYPGVRIENIAFPDTISEVQASLFTCLSEKDIPQALILPANQKNDENLLNFWKREYDLQIQRSDNISGIKLYKALLPNDIDIDEKLIELLERAVVPNSNFPVSSLLKTSEGFISGVNIECSEWTFGLCSERLSIVKAISLGYNEVEALYIHTKYGEFSSPCGSCRQVIMEHMRNKPVVLFHANKTHSLHISSDLMPFSFQSSLLSKTATKLTD